MKGFISFRAGTLAPLGRSVIALAVACSFCPGRSVAAQDPNLSREADAERPEETPRDQSGEPVDVEQVAATIRELDNDRYAVRQAAQRQLALFGSSALSMTAETAVNGTLESSTRAVHVLWTWAESDDKALSLAALEKIAGLANRPTEAADATRRLAGIRELAAIEALVELGAHIEADRTFGVMGIAEAPLQIVVGPNWKGGTEGLKHVANVRRATTLSIWSAPLDDAAIPELEKLGNVRRMELYGLEMNPVLVTQAQEKLPNTMIEVRKGGARLGIRGIDAIEIVPNSPASKAGLVVHDRIIEFNGVKIDEFEELTAEIGKCKPGDTVDIKYRRGTETRDAKVTFDRWGDDVGTKPSLDVPAEEQGLFGPIPKPGPTRIFPPIQIETTPDKLLPREPTDPALPK